MRLFHGTSSEFESPRVSGYDALFWTTYSSAVAQTYIPEAGGIVIANVPESWYLDSHVVPKMNDAIYSIVVNHLGKPAEDIEFDRTGRALRWKIPENYPTYREVQHVIENELGYKPDPHVGIYRLKQMHWSPETGYVFAPAAWLLKGWLWIVEGADVLKIYDYAQGRESSLIEPDYHDLDLFRKVRAAGYDGIRISDFCQTQVWGNVGHNSVGFFEHALEHLQFARTPARHFEWGESVEDLVNTQDTDEYRAWQAATDDGRLLAIQGRLRANEEVIMSDADYEALIDGGLLDTDMASMPNPYQVGTRDSLLVGRITCPTIAAARRRSLMAA